MEELRNPISRMKGGVFYFFPDKGIMEASLGVDLGSFWVRQKNTFKPMGLFTRVFLHKGEVIGRILGRVEKGKSG